MYLNTADPALYRYISVRWFPWNLLISGLLPRPPPLVGNSSFAVPRPAPLPPASSSPRAIVCRFPPVVPYSPLKFWIFENREIHEILD